MIAREWKTRVPMSEKEGFLRYLNETGVKDAKESRGQTR